MATIGWIRPNATSTPFHRPQATAASSEPKMTTGKGTKLYVGSPTTAVMLPWRLSPMILGSMRMQATDAEIAMTAPTDRSTPPVAMTRVIPIASTTVGALLRRMSTRLPYRWPSLTSRPKNPGTKIRSNSRMTPRAMIGTSSRLPRSPPTSTAGRRAVTLASPRSRA